MPQYFQSVFTSTPSGCLLLWCVIFNFWLQAYVAKKTDMKNATKILEGLAVLQAHVLEIVDDAMILAAKSTPGP